MNQGILAQRLDNPETVRHLAMGIGVGSVVFGAVMDLAPRFFSRVFGAPAGDDPNLVWLVRTVGVRDMVIGMGLWSAAKHRGNYRPWLLARLLSDSLDTLNAALAFRAGARNPRFFALAAIALSAAVLEFVVYRFARHASESP